uniref:Proteinase-activated receptor 1 n=1 Tax=Leptobrachium leishanense TaxID=445787 RepID=A0A8C5Q846_9ANUR
MVLRPVLPEQLQDGEPVVYIPDPCPGRIMLIEGDYRPFPCCTEIAEDISSPVPICKKFAEDLFYDPKWGSSNIRISELAYHYLTSSWLIKFIPCIYSLVFIISMPLNVMAIIIFLFKMKVRNPAILYMLNLAVADVLFISVLPFKITYHFLGNNWPFSSGMCRFVTAAFYCNMYCSILLMMSISVDRFLGIVFPIHSLSWRTLGRASVVCILVWVMSMASTVPILISEQTMYIPILNITTCHDVLDVEDQQTFYGYYFSSLCLLYFFVPLIFITVSYVGIIHRLRASNIGNGLKKKQAIFLSIIVFCIFTICFGPTNIIFLSHYLNFSGEIKESLYVAHTLCVCVSSISCCLDSFIYFYVSPECRNHVYRLLCRTKAVNLNIKKPLRGARIPMENV